MAKEQFEKLVEKKVSRTMRFIKHMSRIDLIQSAIILILVIVILLNNYSLLESFLGKLNPLFLYQQQLTHANRSKLALEFDRMRLEDSTNILLALQEFYYANNQFPENLDELKKTKLLDQNSRLTDPSTRQAYFYKKLDQDFVLCILLSDMIKGVNTNQCPQ